MAHAHDHSHGDHRLEQICTLVISGLLGLVCILLWQRNALDLILAKQFHLPVLLGGISLLALVAVSAVMNLITSRPQTHAADDHACDGHSHCDHEHGTAGHENHDHAHDQVHAHAHEHGHACDHDHAHSHE